MNCQMRGRWPLLVVSCCLLLAAFPARSVLSSEIPYQQTASVSIADGAGIVEQQSSAVVGPLELQVGHTFNEAELRTTYLPDVAPEQGLFGQLYVSAISLPGEGERSGEVNFEYAFRLDNPAEYTVRYNKQGAAETSFVIEHNTSPLVSFTAAENQLLMGRFAPGDYRLSIEASAVSSFASSGVVQQDFSQIDFGLLLLEVPEPASVTLFVLLGATALALHRRLR